MQRNRWSDNERLNDDMRERDGEMSRNSAAGIPPGSRNRGFRVICRWTETGTGGQEVG